MEFFLNVFIKFAKFSDKIFVITVKGLEVLPTNHHSASKTHVRDRTIKFSQIHVSVIIRFPEFAEFSESYVSFRKNSRGVISTGPMALIWGSGHLLFDSTGPDWPPKFKTNFIKKIYKSVLL